MSRTRKEKRYSRLLVKSRIYHSPLLMYSLQIPGTGGGGVGEDGLRIGSFEKQT